MDEIQSWWQVPSIAHFCSLFQAAFDLLHFDIEELEEALISDATQEDNGFLTELVVRLLRGCYGRKDINNSNFDNYLKDIIKHRWELESQRPNPMQNDHFKNLSLHTKVEILHALCDYRLDADDVMEALKGLEAEKMRIEPVGTDDKGATYWYFYGTRLYREDPYIAEVGNKRKEREKERRRKEKEKKKKKSKKSKKKERKKKMKFKRKKNGSSSDRDSDGEDTKADEEEMDENSIIRWRIVCSTEEEWKNLADSFKKSKSKNEQALHLTLVEFLPEIPGLFAAKERALKKKILEMLPRRTSGRIEQKRHQKDDELLISAMNNNEKPQEIDQRKLQQIAEEENQRLKEEQQQAREERARRAKLREERLSLLSQGKELPSYKLNHKVINKKKSRQKRKNYKRCSQLEELYVGLFKVLETVQNHPDIWPFQEPVQEAYAPGYFNVIKRPMDISSIEKKLSKWEYKNKLQFMDDFQLIFDNCQKYNGPKNEYTEMAQTIKKCFVKALAKYFPAAESEDEHYISDDSRTKRESLPKREASLRAIEALTHHAEEAFKDNSFSSTSDIESPHSSTRSQTASSPLVSSSRSNSPQPIIDKSEETKSENENFEQELKTVKPKGIALSVENNSKYFSISLDKNEESSFVKEYNISDSKQNFENTHLYSNINEEKTAKTKIVKEPLEKLKQFVSNPSLSYSCLDSQCNVNHSQTLSLSPNSTTQTNRTQISQTVIMPYSSLPEITKSSKPSLDPVSLPSNVLSKPHNVVIQQNSISYHSRSESSKNKRDPPMNLINVYSSKSIHPPCRSHSPKQQNPVIDYSKKFQPALLNGQCKTVEPITWSKLSHIHHCKNLANKKHVVYDRSGNEKYKDYTTSSNVQNLSHLKEDTKPNQSEILRQQQNRASVIQDLSSYSTTLTTKPLEWSQVQDTSHTSTFTTVALSTSSSDISRPLLSTSVQSHSFLPTTLPNRTFPKKENFNTQLNHQMPCYKSISFPQTIYNNNNNDQNRTLSKIIENNSTKNTSLSEANMSVNQLPSHSVITTSTSNSTVRSHAAMSKSNESHIELPAKKRKLNNFFFEENKSKIWRPGLDNNDNREINGIQRHAENNSSLCKTDERTKMKTEVKYSENIPGKKLEIKENNVNNNKTLLTTAYPFSSNSADVMPESAAISSVSVPQTKSQSLINTMSKMNNEESFPYASGQFSTLASKKQQPCSQTSLPQMSYMIHMVNPVSSGVHHSSIGSFDQRLRLPGSGVDHCLFQQYLQQQQQIRFRVHQEQLLYQQQMLNKPLPAHYHPQFITGNNFLEPKHTYPPAAHSQQSNIFPQTAYMPQLRNSEIIPAYYNSLTKPH